MKIVICGSLVFVHEMDEVANKLKEIGHEPVVPLGVDLVKTRGVTLEKFEDLKERGEHHKLTIQYDAIRKHYHKIVEGDAILVTNWEKKGIPNYIGGNTFLEMGFAHVHHKPIYILNGIPDLPYADEIHAMEPTVLKGELEGLVSVGAMEEVVA